MIVAMLAALAVLGLLSTTPAWSQAVVDQDVLGQAASELRREAVFVDPGAERGIPSPAADQLESTIDAGETPIFVAILPASAAVEAGGDPGAVPVALAEATGLSGTYAVVVGNSFRAASDVLPSDQVAALATSTFQARQSDGVEAVLVEFVDRVQAAAGERPAPRSRDPGATGDEGGDGSSGFWLLALLGLGGAGLFFWQRKQRGEQQARRRETEADRQMLRAELSVLGDDVTALEPEITLNPDARADYDAGVSRYRAGQAALEYAGDDVDLLRVGRVIDEGRYAMNRARARVEGREPPPPPEELRVPGRHDEPALDVDDRGEPVYAGGTPFYGGGWYGGGGGGLFTGLLLGQMLGGGWGYGHHDHGGGDAGGDDSQLGGDWGGGGDFGGGDFGGGGDF
ncbi:hypothetical protein BH24ACT1_BH24ACT1_13360 [soil metagenome]